MAYHVVREEQHPVCRRTVRGPEFPRLTRLQDLTYPVSRPGSLMADWPTATLTVMKDVDMHLFVSPGENSLYLHHSRSILESLAE
jgi:hypothetical protein